MSCPTLRRYGPDKIMLSPYRNPLNSNKIKQKISNDDSRKHQLTSKETSSIIEAVKPNTSEENKFKGGSLKENIEINDNSLDEVLHNNNF